MLAEIPSNNSYNKDTHINCDCLCTETDKFEMDSASYSTKDILIRLVAKLGHLIFQMLAEHICSPSYLLSIQDTVMLPNEKFISK